MNTYKRHRFPPGCGFAFNFDPLFALKNEPAVTDHLHERSIEFGFLVDQAAVQISVEIGSIFDAVQQLDIISSGDMAEPVFLEMIDERTEPDRKETLRKALLRYCHLDSLAMQRLAHFLESRQ